MKDKKKQNHRGEHRKPFAKKSFGQNFLVDQNYINKIIASLNLKKDETIIEIGPGRGALTEKLIESGAKVVAIELERDMIEVLRGRFGNEENFQLIESDVLKIDFKELLSQLESNPSVKLVANLPYYISTAILQKLIGRRELFSEIILMFQREVVERITANPGDSNRGYLTVLSEAFLKVEKLFDVPPAAFRPAPKVWSAVVRLITKEDAEDAIKDEMLFRQIIGAGFSQKRKTILNNLKAASGDLPERIEKRGGLANILKESNIAPNRRAETLTLEEWKELTERLS